MVALPQSTLPTFPEALEAWMAEGCELPIPVHNADDAVMLLLASVRQFSFAVMRAKQLGVESPMAKIVLLGGLVTVGHAAANCAEQLELTKPVNGDDPCPR
jgi:hypothetical protein